MELTEEFGRYLGQISASLGRAERKAGLQEYCRALMLPLKRKSIEPLAAAIDPYHVPALHQSLHHFVADSPWSDEAVLGAVQSWVLPRMMAQRHRWVFLIADDSGMPKQGTHSVGVARQYCGQLGKTANCQVAVSLSLATAQASLPIAYRLYLPEAWTEDPIRCRTAGVPAEVKFATKPKISLAQIKAAKQAGVPGDVVAADAGYGDETDYRDGISALGLRYVVGIKPGTTVWEPGTGPLLPKPWSGRGRKPTRLRPDMKRTGTAKKPLRQGDKLQARIEADLQAIQRNPKLVRSFFRAPSVAYISDWLVIRTRPRAPNQIVRSAYRTLGIAICAPAYQPGRYLRRACLAHEGRQRGR